jgi:effector-binding domain-containing protein
MDHVRSRDKRNQKYPRHRIMGEIHEGEEETIRKASDRIAQTARDKILLRGDENLEDHVYDDASRSLQETGL